MVVIIAFSHRDAHLAQAQAEYMTALGGCRNHRLLLVAAPSVAAQLEGLRKIHAENFGIVNARVAEGVRENGFPQAANDMFRACTRLLWQMGNRDPFFYCEPDVAPLKIDWADALATAFNQAGPKRFLGVIQPTSFEVSPGRWEKRASEPHMVGAGVYPWDFSARSKLLLFATDEPWDTYMRWEIGPEAAHTNLIQHNWNTRNYRREAGAIVCDPAHPMATAQPLRGDAVVLHGCKDNSIYAALRAPAVVSLSSSVASVRPVNRQENVLDLIRSEPPKVRKVGKRGVAMKQGRGGKNRGQRIEQSISAS